MEQTPFPSSTPQTYANDYVNEQELERERLREMLTARRMGPIEETWRDYQRWSEEHPYQSLAAETVATQGASALAGAAARLPGYVGTAARGLKWLEEHTGGKGQEGWGGGRNIKDPKYRLETRYKDDELAEYTVHRAKGDEGPVGRMRFDYNPDKKQLYLGWASKNEDEPDIGTGQLMHLFKEVGKDYPDAETVRFFRIPNTQKEGGGAVGRKGYATEVTLPLKRREKGVESEATREMFGKAVEQEQKGSRVIRRRMEESHDVGDDPNDIPPDFSLLDLSPHEREIANLYESGGLDQIMHYGSQRFSERAQRLGSADEASRVGDQIRDKALHDVLGQMRQQSGTEGGPLPSFDDAYDTALHLESRAQEAAWRREEQRLNRLMEQIRGQQRQGEIEMEQTEPGQYEHLGRPLERPVATRHGYGTPEHYEQRSEIENVTPLEHAKVRHIAQERGISEDEALDTYNAIQDRMMEDRLWDQTLWQGARGR